MVEKKMTHLRETEGIFMKKAILGIIILCVGNAYAMHNNNTSKNKQSSPIQKLYKIDQGSARYRLYTGLCPESGEIIQLPDGIKQGDLAFIENHHKLTNTLYNPSPGAFICVECYKAYVNADRELKQHVNSSKEPRIHNNSEVLKTLIHYILNDKNEAHKLYQDGCKNGFFNYAR